MLLNKNNKKNNLKSQKTNKKIFLMKLLNNKNIKIKIKSKKSIRIKMKKIRTIKLMRETKIKKNNKINVIC
jgi:hypothetical protein